jgi:hypothetical protein
VACIISPDPTGPWRTPSVPPAFVTVRQSPTGDYEVILRPGASPVDLTSALLAVSVDTVLTDAYGATWTSCCCSGPSPASRRPCYLRELVSRRRSRRGTDPAVVSRFSSVPLVGAPAAGVPVGSRVGAADCAVTRSALGRPAPGRPSRAQRGGSLALPAGGRPCVFTGDFLLRSLFFVFVSK